MAVSLPTSPSPCRRFSARLNSLWLNPERGKSPPRAGLGRWRSLPAGAFRYRDKCRFLPTWAGRPRRVPRRPLCPYLRFNRHPLLIAQCQRRPKLSCCTTLYLGQIGVSSDRPRAPFQGIGSPSRWPDRLPAGASVNSAGAGRMFRAPCQKGSRSLGSMTRAPIILLAKRRKAKGERRLIAPHPAGGMAFARYTRHIELRQVGARSWHACSIGVRGVPARPNRSRVVRHAALGRKEQA